MLTGNNASFAYNGVGSLGSFDFSSIPRYLADTVLTPIRFLFIPDSAQSRRMRRRFRLI
ncbi:MAG: hypothetical protein ACLUHE_01150 [Christensenellales bacterium]